MLKARVLRLWNAFLADNLFRNTVYLILTTGLMGGLGFFFWLICTHLFTPEQIGIGTTLISAMTLISFISLLGFNSTFVRILPNSKNRDAEINTGMLLVMGTAAVIAIAYLTLIPYLTPSLSIIRSNVWFSLGFIIMVALASINSLTDSIFVAFRSTQFNLLTDGVITAGTKLILPLAFMGLGAYGIFAASGLAASFGMIGSIVVLMTRFNYRPMLRIDVPTLRNVFTYSSANYLANLFTIAPTLILPILVLSHLGAAAAGYYYLAFMIINLLYTVSGSISESLFAEGSYGERELLPLIKRTAIFLAAVMFPTALVLAIAGPFVLRIFGASYSAGGASVIIILAIAAPAVAAFTIGSTLLRIRHQIASLIVSTVLYAVAVDGLSLLWIPNGLNGVALAWLAGNVLAALCCFTCLFLKRGEPTPVHSLTS